MANKFVALVVIISVWICVPISAVSSVLPSNFAQLPDDVQALLLEYAFFNDQVNQHWGEQASFASQKAYVKYLDDYLSRATVDFEKGQLVVETLATSEPKKQLSNAIVTALLTPDDPAAVELFSARKVSASGKPFLLGQVLDQSGKSIAYEWRAKQFAQYLLNNQLNVKQTSNGVRYWVNIPMVSNHTEVAAKGVKAWVSEASNRFNLPESLILAIIETESGFNPFAVSHANAYGLMQIIPSTAGADVFQKVLKKTGKPSRDYLFNAKNNITVGSAYLKILRDRYLSKIKHPTSQLYCIISAYNSGAGNVFKTFHSSRKQAIQRINSLSPADVLWRLRKHQPSHEARRYVEKVLAFQKKY
ncbi:membrane-bound lytic murein transglycosylase MltC [Oceaniserpentilla sp. 4NH20-0058]|uniref:murein transglycosylase domain-containing protein n=1 Tax=Oceaniserpentilla sp. 4NH20-0058 TaxID=3127660 RepID=UPI003103905C